MTTTFEDVIVAPSFTGNVTGNTTGAHVGPVTGATSGTHTGNVIGNVNGGEIHAGVAAAGDGAIAIPAASGDVYITKGSIAALTIAAPTAGTDDNKELTIWSETAFAHVITCASDGFNSKGASGTLTFGGAKGDSVKIKARNGHWWVTSANNVTPA